MIENLIKNAFSQSIAAEIASVQPMDDNILESFMHFQVIKSDYFLPELTKTILSTPKLKVETSLFIRDKHLICKYDDELLKSRIVPEGKICTDRFATTKEVIDFYNSTRENEEMWAFDYGGWEYMAGRSGFVIIKDDTIISILCLYIS
jgi:hypothetical protein